MVPGDAAETANGKGTESRGAACLIQALGIALLARLLHSTKQAALPHCHEGAVLRQAHSETTIFFSLPLLLQKADLTIWPFSFNIPLIFEKHPVL